MSLLSNTSLSFKSHCCLFILIKHALFIFAFASLFTEVSSLVLASSCCSAMIFIGNFRLMMCYYFLESLNRRFHQLAYFMIHGWHFKILTFTLIFPLYYEANILFPFNSKIRKCQRVKTPSYLYGRLGFSSSFVSCL